MPEILLLGYETHSPRMQETQETWVQSLVGEYPLEEEMATHASILAWEIPGTEEPGGSRGRATVHSVAMSQT